MPRRLAIVCTHPIQYYAPVFRCLAAAAGLETRVFYTWSQAAGAVFDSGFGTAVRWDLPLLEGYAHQFVRNVASRPGPERFAGLRTPTLVDEIAAWEPHALLVYTWNSHAHLRAMRQFHGRVPVLFRGDSTLIDQRPWWRAALRRIALTWVYRHVDLAIAVGSNNHDYFRWCGLPTRRIAYAPHSVDTSRFAGRGAEHETRAAQWRRDLGIEAQALVLLFAGKLQRKKNPLLLFEAFSGLRNGSHLVFVGDGELEPELKARAQGMDNVHFLPFQNQSVMPAVYRLADVFVLPSQGPEETWGLALNEAMASGRAVIASSKVGGARDLVRPPTNGWLFESGDRRALQAVLREAVALGRDGLHAMGAVAQSQSSEWSTEECARCIGQIVLALQPTADACLTR